MKNYCTQNEGDCKTCSLTNYNRDCRNNPLMEIHYKAGKYEIEYEDATYIVDLTSSQAKALFELSDLIESNGLSSSMMTIHYKGGLK